LSGEWEFAASIAALLYPPCDASITSSGSGSPGWHHRREQSPNSGLLRCSRVYCFQVIQQRIDAPVRILVIFWEKYVVSFGYKKRLFWMTRNRIKQTVQPDRLEAQKPCIPLFLRGETFCPGFKRGQAILVRDLSA
jgi:hypothetical protein